MGHKNLNKINEYNSLNTKELNLNQTISLLKKQLANETNRF
jgi:hypothetical protein